MNAEKLQREMVDFVAWLTPCGEVTPSPSVETIGKKARKLYRKILKKMREQKP